MNTPTVPIAVLNAPLPRRSPGIWAGLVVLLLMAVAVFLTLPLANLAVQPWLAQWQRDLQNAFTQAGPLISVALLGAVVGLAEISSTFPNYPREALRTRWARILVLVNAVAAAAAYLIVSLYAVDASPILLVLGVGIGFQAIIRTRFTIAKQIGGSGEGDVSLNLGWLYDQFQNLCKTQIDLELMNDRQSAMNRLLLRFSMGELYNIGRYTILARATLSPEEEKAKQTELDKLMAQNVPEDFAKASMALLILETGGQAYVDFLLSRTESEAPKAPAITDAITTITKLAQRYASLPDLYQITRHILEWRSKLAPEEKAARIEELDHLLNSETPLDFKRAGMARLLVENGDAATINILLSQAIVNVSEATSPDNLVRRLVESYSLAQMVEFAERLTDAPDILEWVRKAAQPDPEVSAANQKAAIAHFLVQRLGVESVLKALEAASAGDD